MSFWISSRKSSVNAGIVSIDRYKQLDRMHALCTVNDAEIQMMSTSDPPTLLKVQIAFPTEPGPATCTSP
jgi:hypothetical protein